MIQMKNWPKQVCSGIWQGGHCQGIAVDEKNGWMLYSFTTMLVKTDLNGRFIGSVRGLLGHLGCIAFCKEDGRLYGSLEYKSDAIGRGILARAGSDADLASGFYIAVFDVSRIDRPNMDASADGVMTTVFLPDVLNDYEGHGLNGAPHRYGCSGIDGVTFGPLPGSDDPKQYLFVAYGVYGDTQREDNDHQVLLCYDTQDWDRYEQPLEQTSMHRNGPACPLHRFFVPTGNTTYGVQNLEYDAASGLFLMAVYPGKKPQYPNYRLFAVDASKSAECLELFGLAGERGEVLSLRGDGWHFAWGSTGLCALGDGLFYISHDEETQQGFASCARLYRWNGVDPFELV